jgi:aspartate-semialdehyde dehydrogenase
MRVGVVGATGLVGSEVLRVLDERAFPVTALRVYASPRSEGRRLAFGGDEVVCERLRDGCFEGLELVIMDTDEPIAAEWAPRAVAAGARVIDKSAAFRMDPEVPLVVAEVNPQDLAGASKGIISCPNCTTVVFVMAMAPLHRAAGIERVVVSTYQSVSGAGQAGMRELAEQWTKGAGQEEVLRRAGASRGGLEPGDLWPVPIAGNVIPLAGARREAGYTSEEWKLVRESRKILHAPDLEASVTCVRVPVYVGHAMSANVRFARALPRAEAAAVLARAPGVTLVEDGEGAPTPLDAAGVDPVLVGRLREDPFQDRTLDLWATGDNLRKGAALNGVQLAELLLDR